VLVNRSFCCPRARRAGPQTTNRPQALWSVTVVPGPQRSSTGRGGGHQARLTAVARAGGVDPSTLQRSWEPGDRARA
jgi:hypothetical protein